MNKEYKHFKIANCVHMSSCLLSFFVVLINSISEAIQYYHNGVWFILVRSSNPPTIVYFSVECFDSAISFSHLTWQSSSGPGTSFNIRASEVSFWHCTFENLNFYFTGLSLNLSIQNTTIRNCSSQSTHLPLFFMQVLSYSYDTTIFIQNSTFSNNRSPIMYALQFHQIHLENVLFLKNGRDLINMPMLTVSGSSVIIEKSLFSLNLGTAINVKNVGKFRVSKVQFLSNNVLNGSCLVVKRHSNVSLVDTIFKQNTNPVVFLKDGDGVQVLLKVWFPLHPCRILLPIYSNYSSSLYVVLGLAIVSW